MFNGKMKAITFSYDDGVTQDRRLVDIFDRYGLKATFNINSDLLGTERTLDLGGKAIAHNKVEVEEVATLYRNHEVAVHTLTHPNLTGLPEEEIIRQVEQDRLRLSELCGYEVIGMAYPCGGVNNDDRVAKVIRDHTGVQFSRTITSTWRFDKQENLLRFNPTVYHQEWDKMLELTEQFLALDTEEPALLYIWGHSYEFDANGHWEDFEKFCEHISGRDDIFYGTNREVLL